MKDLLGMPYINPPSYERARVRCHIYIGCLSQAAPVLKNMDSIECNYLWSVLIALLFDWSRGGVYYEPVPSEEFNIIHPTGLKVELCRVGMAGEVDLHLVRSSR